MHGHGEKPYLCTYEGCERSLPGHGFPRQWNLRDHMRRVHNDNGTTVQPASPPPSGNSASTRGRKRKNDTDKAGQDKSSGRKSSTKSASDAAASAAKAAELQASADIDEWYNHQRALQSLVQEYVHPDDPQSLRFVKDAQGHLTAMGKISHELVATNKAEVLQRPYGRSWKG